MNNELSVQQNKEVSIERANLINEWGVPQTSAQDIIIPKILPLQGLSVLVTQRKGMMGEFRSSIDGALIGSIDTPFECIPFFLDKTWDVKAQQADGSYKWIKSVPVVENPASPDYNDNWKWEGVLDGAKVQNIRRFNYYVLLPSEVANGAAIPYMFSFKSTSIKQGKTLYTQMFIKNIKAGLPPAAFTIKIGGSIVTNPKGTYVVPSYTMDRKATDKELQECLTWIKMIKGGKVKVDTTDEDMVDASVSADGTGEF